MPELVSEVAAEDSVKAAVDTQTAAQADEKAAANESQKPDAKVISVSDHEREIRRLRDKWNSEMTVKEASAKEQAAREAKEAKLLEDGKLEELAAMKTKEAEAAQAELAAYKRNEKVNALLDKKEMLDPRLRSFASKIPGDLEELNDIYDGFMELVTELAGNISAKDLGTVPPPKGNAKTEEPLSRSEELRAARNDPIKWAEIKKRDGIYTT